MHIRHVQVYVVQRTTWRTSPFCRDAEAGIQKRDAQRRPYLVSGPLSDMLCCAERASERAKGSREQQRPKPPFIKPVFAARGYRRRHQHRKRPSTKSSRYIRKPRKASWKCGGMLFGNLLELVIQLGPQ